jgi:phospholipid-binding lipoprotein MlaA
LISSFPPSVRASLLGAAISLFLLGGCATHPDPRDPFEPVNRVIYEFNDGFDRVVAKPVAEIYRAVLPPLARTGIGNFFSNLNDVIVALNDLLQGKMPEAINGAGRVMVNTTLGVLGFMDPATELGVEKRNEDFGQTLGYWGLGDGPYIVLPFLGPSNLRDTVGWVGDVYAWPGTYVNPTRDRNALIALRFTSTRADLLHASQLLETAALDPYEFLRDAYLQRRRYLVHDGNPPEEEEFREKPKPTSSGPQAPALRMPESSTGSGTAGGKPAVNDETRRHSLEPELAVAAPRARAKDRGVRIWLPDRNY